MLVSRDRSLNPTRVPVLVELIPGAHMWSLRLHRQFAIFAIALFAATAGSPLSRGQSITNVPRAASAQTALLRQAARKAGFIFSGTVLSVQQLPSRPGGVNRVRITFSVHEAVRGVGQGKTFTVDQWASLWANQANQFRPGDRVYLLLYPRSKLGLTSVVAGGLGRYDLDSNWRVVGTNQKPGIVVGRLSRPVPSRPQPRGSTQSHELSNIIRPRTE